MSGEVTYRDSGVDIEQADRLVSRFGALARSTVRPGVLGGLGGFGGLFALKDAVGDLKDPVLVSGTDGVGTKLKVAVAAGQHTTVGIDLVAMCVNDILCVGAKPLFFLDYFASAKLEPAVAEAVVAGIAEGCQRAKCALIGGETAELPGMYAAGDYDLAGFAVGVVERANLIDAFSSVAEGHAVVGILSHGLHSNGFSLAREVFFNRAGLSLEDKLAPDAEESIMEALLKPTAIYTDFVQELVEKAPPAALAHITGGGIPGNLARVIPPGLTAELKRETWPVPRVFSRLAELGPVAQDEMDATFNMGLGLIAVTPEPGPTLAAALNCGFEARVVGQLRPTLSGEGSVLIK